MNSGLKNKILFAGILLLLVACYRLAIGKTLDLRSEHRLLEEKTTSLKDTPARLAILRKKERYYDSIIQRTDLGGTSVQNNLLRFLNRETLKNGAKIIDFRPPHIFRDENREVTTYSFKIQGSYNHILRTVYLLEQKVNFGQVVHVRLDKKTNYRIRAHTLEAIVFIQQRK
ncbi:MAG: hypothetical protein AAFO99_09580 [Bacteroidota bacterium]